MWETANRLCRTLKNTLKCGLSHIPMGKLSQVGNTFSLVVSPMIISCKGPFDQAHFLTSRVGWPTKSLNFLFPTKMVFPKSLKFMSSGSEYMNSGLSKSAGQPVNQKVGPKHWDSMKCVRLAGSEFGPIGCMLFPARV